MIAAELSRAGRPADGVLIVPAFADAGRITVESVHYAGNPKDGYAPVGETEFARDATFGYASSDLRNWVQEKTAGQGAAAEVARITLRQLRHPSPGAALDTLLAAGDQHPIVVDQVDENDLRALALVVLAAEEQGKRFVYRAAAIRPRQGRHHLL